jgi:hypothetical protein
MQQPNFTLAENILKLGTREKETVKVILLGFRESKRLTIGMPITCEKPFNLIDFANVMHEVGVDISSTRKTEQIVDGTRVTFQPKPYENSNYLKGIIASQQTTNQFIKSFIDYEPPQVKSEPQK